MKEFGIRCIEYSSSSSTSGRSGRTSEKSSAQRGIAAEAESLPSLLAAARSKVISLPTLNGQEYPVALA